MANLQLTDTQVIGLISELSSEGKREAARVLVRDLLEQPAEATSEELLALAEEVVMPWPLPGPRPEHGTFLVALDDAEEPESLISEALREMGEAQIRNRDRAVGAMTQRDGIAHLVDQERRLLRDLDEKIASAEKSGNQELARQFRRERDTHRMTAREMEAALVQAEEAVMAVKQAILREEERFRVRTAEALALKARLRAAAYQAEIEAASSGWEKEAGSAQWQRALDRVERRISHLQEMARNASADPADGKAASG